MTQVFNYGERSLKNLKNVHPVLQEIAEEALRISPVDISIIHGWRGKEEQNRLYDEGKSKLKYPQSKHNHTVPNPQQPNSGQQVPMSLAIDFAPYLNGIEWNDTHAFAVIAGVMMSVAKRMGHTLRWGGDWDMDGRTTDQTFMDWGHVELVV